MVLMILIFALTGTFTATIAGVTVLIMGQPWWMGLASYIAAGMITVSISAVFTALSLKSSMRTSEVPTLRELIPLAEH